MHKERRKHTWKALTEVFDGGGLFLFSDLLVLLLIGGGLETLPRKASSEEVHEYVTESFEIISSRLLSSQVCVDTHVSGRA